MLKNQLLHKLNVEGGFTTNKLWTDPNFSAYSKEEIRQALLELSREGGAVQVCYVLPSNGDEPYGGSFWLPAGSFAEVIEC